MKHRWATLLDDFAAKSKTLGLNQVHTGAGQAEFEDKDETVTSVPSEEAGEKQQKWEPVEGIVTPVASALVVEDRDGLIVTLLFSQIVDGCSSDLQVKFGRVLAYTVYEEFMHPWDTSKAAPRLEGRWQNFIYPLLQIRDSRWISSLPDCLFVYPDAMHYRFLTLDEIVDVLCRKPPEVTWVARP